MGTAALRRACVAIAVVSLVLGTAWSGRATTARSEIDPGLRAGDTALIQVAPGTAWSVAGDLAAGGATEVAAFDSVDVVTARMTEPTLASLVSDRDVRRATTDVTVVAFGDGKEKGKDLDTLGTHSGRDSIGNVAIGAPSAWSRSTGAGVVVALMDSGIAAHPDLPAAKVVARVDLVQDNARTLDPAGHGTHLAGVIAANGESFRGVAPDARLVDIRVLDQNGTGTLRNVVAGFDWLLKHRTMYGIRVLNVSFGAEQTTSYHDDLLSALVEAAWFSGVVVVAAAGNEGAPRTITSPGSDPFVITTGSFDDQGTPADADDRESAFSSKGPTKDGFAKPDVLAPGRRVVSLRVPGSSLETERPDRVTSLNGRRTSTAQYIRMSGTSVSSAMVAGVAALVLALRPSYSPTKTKGAIVASGRALFGSLTRAIDAPAALSTPPRPVNVGLLPSALLMETLERSGVARSGVTWEGVTWEGVTWEGVTWESVSWESVSWETVTWEGVMWETVSWEQRPGLDGPR